MAREFGAVVCLAAALAGCGVRNDNASILLFDGAGTSPGDVEAVRAILNRQQLAYATVGSGGLNRMDEAQIRRYRLLIVPGGNFIHIGNGLTADATAKVRSAVKNGLNYLGICAGGFLAGDTGYNSFNLATGVKFRFYSAEERGIRKAAVPISVVEGATLEHYWEDGPQLTGWGETVAKYPDGTPAVVQGAVGSGWVVLSGVHPEAPDSWRRGMIFATPASTDNAYAATLVQAALNRTALPHY